MSKAETKNPKSQRKAAVNPEPAPSKKTSTPEPAAAPGPMDAVMQLLQPLLDFHKAAEGANDTDVRLHWDVRLVRGKDEFLKGVTGNSTLPGLLSPNNLSHAPHTIHSEILEKIAKPLAELLQERTNETALEEAPPLVGGSEPARIAHREEAPPEPKVDLSADAEDPTEGMQGVFDKEEDVEEGNKLPDDGVDES